MILTIYDISGIQSYVFSTNKLKEMVGASTIIHRALYENIPLLFGEGVEDWTTRDFSWSEGEDRAKTIYIGGGNALVAYDAFDTERDFTRELQKLVFAQSGGAIRLCAASIEADDTQTLAENQRNLMDKLDRVKRRTPPTATAKGFSINAHENTTFEPILLHENGRLATRAQFLKREAFKKSQSGDVPLLMDCDAGSWKFADNFDQFRQLGKKNHLAVIHIDGNTMGMRIRSFVSALSGDLCASLDKLGKLSNEINKVYKTVLSETVKALYLDQTERGKDLPFRPVIVDGDDVTVICTAEDAFRFVSTFMQKLRETTLRAFAEAGIDPTLTAAAGIAIARQGFPFYAQYEMAEALCKSAKKKALAIGHSGNNSRSSMGFHICYGGLTTDLESFRESHYTFQDAKSGDPVYQLSLRPYIFDAEQEVFDYQKSFADQLALLYYEKNGANAQKLFPRSKLKGLRNAYGESVEAARIYGDFIKARHSGDDSAVVANRLAEPYVLVDGVHYAQFFDVLDMLDFLVPASEEDEEND